MQKKSFDYTFIRIQVSAFKNKKTIYVPGRMLAGLPW